MFLEKETHMAEVVPLRPKRKNEGCPICEKSENSSFSPFCSKHCAYLDLGKWLNGDYWIPTNEEADVDGELPEAEY
jgi:endogenous inhibitor of DNA gyrase (YacG/DUF329 family)